MRTVEEIAQDLKDCYSCESKECLFPIPTTCGKPQDESVITYESEMGKAVINLFGLDRLEELCQAEREGRCVVLPCKVGDTVYWMWTDEEGNCESPIHEDVICEIRVTNKGVELSIDPYDGSIGMIGVHPPLAVFLSPESAEAALKECEHSV